MNKIKKPFHHLPVLHEELINSLNLQPGDIAIDCTTGGGGHTQSLLNKVGKKGLVISFDQDLDAIEHLQKKFAAEVESNQLKIVHSSFSSLSDVTQELQVSGTVQAIIADLGVSSYQLDESVRGFSFQKEGPLDMRMNQDPSIKTAEEVLTTITEEELRNILFKYGEEPRSKRIAKGIIEAREEKKITTTTQLAEVITKHSRYIPGKKHPATKTFQALRIHINKELEELQTLLEEGLEPLKTGGRLAMISFHSLEDRLIKHSFLQKTGISKKPPRELAFSEEELKKIMSPTGQIIKPFPIKPKKQEILDNKRARSAKLRVIEKL